MVLKLKTAWRDRTTHHVMSPLEFMHRLAALVPRPRLHLIRFGVRITSLREVNGPPLREHGVLAPNAKLRALVLPQEPASAAQAAQPAECEANCVHHRPIRAFHICRRTRHAAAHAQRSVLSRWVAHKTQDVNRSRGEPCLESRINQ